MNILGCLDRPTCGHYTLEGVDVANNRAQTLQFTFILSADDFGEECLEHLQRGQPGT